MFFCKCHAITEPFQRQCKVPITTVFWVLILYENSNTPTYRFTIYLTANWDWAVWLVQSPACSKNLIPRPLLPLNLDLFYLNLGCLGVDEPVSGQLASLWVGFKFHLGLGVSKFGLTERWPVGHQLLLRATSIYGQVRSSVNSVFLWINWWIAWRFLCILLIEFELI